jgi:hypothetical protein
MDLEPFLVSLYVLVDDRVSDARSREPKSKRGVRHSSRRARHLRWRSYASKLRRVRRKELLGEHRRRVGG